MFILLYGMSGSGKTTIAEELQHFLNLQNITSTIIPMDYFYKVGKWESFDVPDAFDWNRLKNCLITLRKNEPYTLYPYNYNTHSYEKHLNQTIFNADVIIIEGIYTNHAKFLFLEEPVVIRIETAPDVCLARRILRDVKERNITYEDTIHMWLTNVRPNWKIWNTTPNSLEDTYSISGESKYRQYRLNVYQTIINDYID